MAAPDFQVSVFTVKSSLWIYFHIFLVWTSCYTSVTGQQRVIGSSQAVLAKVGDDVVLPCHIEPNVSADRMTVEWSRHDLKSVIVHLLQDGRERPDARNHFYKNRTSLFTEELPHGNISLKLTRVQLSDNGTFKCNVPTLRSSSLIQLTVEDINGTGKYDCMTEGGLIRREILWIVSVTVGILSVALTTVALILGYLFRKRCSKNRYKKLTPALLKEVSDLKKENSENYPLVPVPSTQTAASSENKPLEPDSSIQTAGSSDWQREVSDLKADKSDLQSTITALKDGAAAMKKENSALQKKVDQNSALQEEVSDLNEENTALQEEVSELKDMIPALDPAALSTAFCNSFFQAFGGTSQTSDDEEVEEEEEVVEEHEMLYELTSKPTGLCVIMHNEKFDITLDPKPKSALRKDCDNLADTFSRLGFEVFMCKDLTKEQMLKTLECFSNLKGLAELQESKVQQWSSKVQQWSREDRHFTEFNIIKDPPQHGDAFVCCFTAPGREDNVLGTDGEPLYITQIIKPFSKVKCLENKPKVFFITAHQGRKKEEYSKKILMKDCLVAMASCNANLFAHSFNGCLFTQSVCKQVGLGSSRGDGLLTIFNEIKKEVSQAVAKNCHTKQTPVIMMDTLTKRLVFPAERPTDIDLD